MREFARDPEAGCTRRPSSSTSAPGTPRSARRASTRAGSSRDELWSSSAASETSSVASRPHDLAAGGVLPSASLYAHTFGSLANALREAGYEVARARSGSSARSSRAHGLRGSSGGCRRWPTGPLPAARRRAPLQWQVYRLLDVPRGAWTAFQFLVRERLREEGVEVRADGTLAGRELDRRERSEPRKARDGLVRRVHGETAAASR